MSMLWVLCLTSAFAGSTFMEPLTLPSAEKYAGSFDLAPVTHWSIDLPGRPLNSSSHTERTRPVVVGDEVLVGSAKGRGLYRLSRHNGTLLGEYPADSSVESEPLVFDGLVFFADTAGSVWCYLLEGDEVWQFSTGAPVLVRPTVHDGVLYVTNVDDLALALDAATGELLWRYQRKPDATRVAELSLYAAPPAVIVDDLVLLGFSDGALVALDRESGAPRWERQVGEGLYPDLVAQPVVVGTDVLVSGYSEPLVAVDLASQNVRWRMEYGSAAQLGVSDDGGPLVTVFHPGTDGVLRSVVALTGAEKWAWDSGTGGALTTPVQTDFGLLIGSSDGGLYALDPNTGRELWRFRQDFLLEGVTAAPSVVGRQLLFTTNAGKLYSMLAPAESTAWEHDRQLLRTPAQAVSEAED